MDKPGGTGTGCCQNEKLMYLQEEVDRLAFVAEYWHNLATGKRPDAA